MVRCALLRIVVDVDFQDMTLKIIASSPYARCLYVIYIGAATACSSADLVAPTDITLF